MVQQYLNKDGYPMSEELKPIFLRKIPKAGSMQRVAKYIVCRETGMLKWIGHCEDCQWFKKHVKYKGVECSFNKNQNKMETEKTRLQKIKEQFEQRMTRAIVEAIDDGAKYEIVTGGGLRIDGVYLTPKFESEYHGLVLNICAPEIEQLFEPSEKELQERAEKLRAELEEVENKLKSK